MTQNTPCRPQVSASRLRYVRTQIQTDTDAILRDLAYVLKLTQQVREEIVSEKEEEQPLAV